MERGSLERGGEAERKTVERNMCHMWNEAERKRREESHDGLCGGEGGEYGMGCDGSVWRVLPLKENMKEEKQYADIIYEKREIVTEVVYERNFCVWVGNYVAMLLYLMEKHCETVAEKVKHEAGSVWYNSSAGWERSRDDMIYVYEEEERLEVENVWKIYMLDMTMWEMSEEEPCIYKYMEEMRRVLTENVKIYDVYVKAAWKNAVKWKKPAMPSSKWKEMTEYNNIYIYGEMKNICDEYVSRRRKWHISIRRQRIVETCWRWRLGRKYINEIFQEWKWKAREEEREDGETQSRRRRNIYNQQMNGIYKHISRCKYKLVVKTVWAQ